MTAGIKAIAFSFPIFTANLLGFVPRRIGRAVDSIDTDPVYSLMNCDIAAGQTLKGVRAVDNLTEISENSAKNKIAKTVATTEKVSKFSKFGKGIMKVVNFTADHINPIIYASGAWKTINSDDKLCTGIEQAGAIGTMRLGEIAYSNLAAMPYYSRNKETGELEKKMRKSPLFSEAQEKALNDTLATKKLFNKIHLKPVVHTAKGLGFVGTSIGFYALGEKVAKNITNKIKAKRNDNEKPQTIKFTPNYDTENQTNVSKVA